MSAHVLLNLLNELRKSNKMLGLQSLLSFFHNNFNKLNKTKSTNIRFYLSHDIKLLKTCFFLLVNVRFRHLLPKVILWTSICYVTKSVNH